MASRLFRDRADLAGTSAPTIRHNGVTLIAEEAPT
jgi:hypothetical protein